MKRKNIIIIILILTIIVTIKYFNNVLKEEENLVENSVYYAKNMPHAKDKHPVLIMLIDNLKYINQPKIDGISYKIDGSNSIINTNIESNFSYITTSNNRTTNGYLYKSKNNFHYEFDYNFNLIYSTQNRTNNIDISTVDEAAIIDEIYEFVKPIVDSQTEPEVNLQEEFNKRYKERFN
ncbi:hypothetical protein [Gemelliphila palaticanis]|uniref:Uncharacterized protein n=1 Tax=Gemelliphila palaticanis TaxID=81950 RepID=A0ABX2SX71_9BACL|nr:hypothetical protein [Gemella palaticanis]MBF0714803.1 hypothetical protein [Gemella palaticanis]NYS46733.1 hypothetical protein [Gemella palaticanis]